MLRKMSGLLRVDTLVMNLPFFGVTLVQQQILYIDREFIHVVVLNTCISTCLRGKHAS